MPNEVDTVPPRSFDVVVTEVALSPENDNMATTDILIVYCINDSPVHGPFEPLKDPEEKTKSLNCTVALGRYVSGMTVSTHFPTEKGTPDKNVPSLAILPMGHSGGGKLTTVDH